MTQSVLTQATEPEAADEARVGGAAPGEAAEEIVRAVREWRVGAGGMQA